MDRNLALEFVRVTEAAAIACSKWWGKGNKIAADHAAVEAMRKRFNFVDFNGEVVIGEGEKDEAPMLFTGEKLGNGTGLEMDIAVDPLECTSNLANGKSNSISVLAAAPKGTLLKAPGTYMEQISVGPTAVGVIDLDASIRENIKNVASVLDKEIGEMTVVILDRDRHKRIIQEIRNVGARVMLIEHGTIAAGIAPSLRETGLDMLMGTGGAPETVINAAALRALGGEIHARLRPHKDKFMQDAIDMGFTDLEKVFKTEDLAKSDKSIFVATGVTTGPFLKGVNFTPHGIETNSIVMRAKTKTIRFVDAVHHLEHSQI